jgi:hypothetical protein
MKLARGGFRSAAPRAAVDQQVVAFDDEPALNPAPRWRRLLFKLTAKIRIDDVLMYHCRLQCGFSRRALRR